MFSVRRVLFLAAISLPALADSFYIAPFLQNVTPDGATIIYQTNEQGQGVVEYGVNGKFDQKATGEANEMIRKVRITGLQPDTAYSYRVKVGSEEKSATFHTAPKPGSDHETTFVIFGDTRRWEKKVEETKFISEIKKWNAEFYIINGDLVIAGHKYENWKEHFDRFGEIGATNMIVTARGNHEGSMIVDKDNDWFAKYHDMPGGEPYVNFTWGNVHVVSLSWEQTTVPAMMGPTAQWLDKHLDDVKTQYSFVTQHFPVYCTGYNSPKDDRKEPGEVMQYLSRVLDKHHITANMSGHTHIFERQYPIREGKRDDRNGVHYLVNGGDINANYPEWWTACSDNGSGLTKPTFSVYQCKKDHMDIRTFAWSDERKKFEQIDRDVAWKDEAAPKKVLASIDTLKGAEQLDAIEEIGAMLYVPAIQKLSALLKSGEAATKQKAAWAISMIGTKESVLALKPYLDDADAEVRYQAARALEVAMPDSMADEVAKRAKDNAQDARVRVKLIGALQLHAQPNLVHDTALAVVTSDAPVDVRKRASYAMTRVAGAGDVQPLAKAVASETDVYVTTRLAFTLNKLTGATQNPDAVAKAKPGDRKEYIDKWLSAPAKEQKTASN